VRNEKRKQTEEKNEEKKRTRLLGGQKQTHIKSDYPRNGELGSMNLGGADKVITECTTDIYSECIMNDIISFKSELVQKTIEIVGVCESCTRFLNVSYHAVLGAINP